MTPKEKFQRLVKKILGKEAQYSQQDIIVVEQSLSELEELKKRDTKMKVILTQYKKVVGNVDEFYMGNMYTCPQCHGVVLMDKWQAPIEHLKAVGETSNYCSSCGQRLDWSDGK